MLGYIIDPFNPALGDDDVLKNLMSRFENIGDFISLTYSLGGRWILIASHGKSTRIFNDATGLRQIYYCRVPNGEVWCASQPDLIANGLNLKKDSEAVEFAESYSKVESEYFLPGDVSLYKEISHLLPNWYLDLNIGKAVRFWPDRPRTEIPADKASFLAAAIIKGLITGMSKRGEIVLSLTAGLDSRLVLSASKEIKEKLVAVSIQKDGSNDHADLIIPAALGDKLGFKHDIVKSAGRLDPRFREIYEKNAVYTHEIWMADAQAISDYNHRKKIVVTGSAAEIARCWYSKHRSLKMDNVRLCILKGMKSKFALASFQRWLDSFRDLYGYHHLDLFDWEMGTGSWLAANQLEFDIAWKEIFTPFNCRELLVLLLSVNERYRKEPGYDLFRRIISRLWPEVLSEPINPHKKKNSAKEFKSYIKFRLRDFKYRFAEYA